MMKNFKTDIQNSSESYYNGNNYPDPCCVAMDSHMAFSWNDGKRITIYKLQAIFLTSAATISCPLQLFIWPHNCGATPYESPLGLRQGLLDHQVN